MQIYFLFMKIFFYELFLTKQGYLSIISPRKTLLTTIIYKLIYIINKLIYF